MSRRREYILFLNDRQWRLGDLESPADTLELIEANAESSPQELAQLAVSSMQARGGEHYTVIVALPSHWCYSATIALQHPHGRDRHQAMLYSLEEKLPLPAEQLTAVFMKNGATALAVSTTVERIQTIVELLESQGIGVRAVVPTSMLTAQALLGQEKLDSPNVAILGGPDGREAELIWFEKAKPSVWRVTSCDAESIERELRIGTNGAVTEAKLACLAIDLPREVTEAVTSPNLQVVPVSGTSECLAATAALALSRGSCEPWFDLSPHRSAARQLGQVRGPLLFAFGMLLALLLSVATSLLIRAQRYSHIGAKNVDAQVALFRQLFPSSAAPSDVHSRLLAEERRLNAVAGGDAREHPTTMQVTALTALHSALRALPADIRFQLLEIRIEDQKLYFEGQARSHGDAESLASALRQRCSLVVQPPRSEQRGDRGVAFVIDAELPDSSSALGATR